MRPETSGVIVVEGKHAGTLRVFSTEVTPEMIEYNRSQLTELLTEPVRDAVHEVALDYLAEDEIEATGC